MGGRNEGFWQLIDPCSDSWRKSNLRGRHPFSGYDLNIRYLLYILSTLNHSAIPNYKFQSITLNLRPNIEL